MSEASYTIRVERLDKDWAIVIRCGDEIIGVPYRERAVGLAESRCASKLALVRFAFEYGLRAQQRVHFAVNVGRVVT